MFFNPFDIVDLNGKNYIVISVENQSLILMDTFDCSYLEADKACCKRVHTIAEIKSKAIFDSSMGLIVKHTTEQTVGGYLAKCTWMDGADLTDSNNSWLYRAIITMDNQGKIPETVKEEFFNRVKELPSLGRVSAIVFGTFDGTPMTIKLTLINKKGVIGVSYVKRVFGDDGVYGHIKKHAGTKGDAVPDANRGRATGVHQATARN